MRHIYAKSGNLAAPEGACWDCGHTTRTWYRGGWWCKPCQWRHYE